MMPHLLPGALLMFGTRSPGASVGLAARGKGSTGRPKGLARPFAPLADGKAALDVVDGVLHDVGVQHDGRLGAGSPVAERYSLPTTLIGESVLG